MGNRLCLGFGLVLLMAAAADPLVCSAEGDPLASPTPRPTQWVAAPEISGVNPEVVKPEGDEGEFTPSGGFPVQNPISVNEVGLPFYLEIVPQGKEKLSDQEGKASSGPAVLAANLDLFNQFLEWLPSSADQSLPWMGILGAVATLALAFNRSSQSVRMGGMLADPRRKIPEGNPDALVGEHPAEKNSLVQVGLRGLKIKVPVYETKRIRAGFKKEIRQVPIYKNVKVCCGSRLVPQKVPLTCYRTQKVWTWKKIVQRVPITRWIGSKRIIIGYREQRRWKRVQVEKRVPYQVSKTILVREPIYQTKKVQSGTKSVTRWVPRYQEKQVLVGYKIVKQTFPNFQKAEVEVKGQKEVFPIPDGGPQEGQEGGPGLPENELRLKEKLLQTNPPEEEIADLLRKGIGPAWPPQESKRLTDSWLCRTILLIRSYREGLGRIVRKIGPPQNQLETPHLVSYSVYRKAPQTLLSREGMLPTSFLPPHFMNLLITRQKMVISPRVEVTAYPDGSLNLNLTRRSCSMKIGNTTLYTTLDGEVGFVKAIDNQGAVYDESRAKHSLSFGSEGICYTSKIEGVIIHNEGTSTNLEVKEIRTIQGQTTTLHVLGILVGVLALFVIAAVLYLYFNAGLPIPIPG